MSATVEIARFKVSEAAEAGLVSTWPAMVEAMRRAHPALRSVSLVRFDDGTWADIALWDDPASAAALACDAGPSLPEVREFFAHIAEDISLDLARVVKHV